MEKTAGKKRKFVSGNIRETRSQRVAREARYAANKNKYIGMSNFELLFRKRTQKNLEKQRKFKEHIVRHVDDLFTDDYDKNQQAIIDYNNHDIAEDYYEDEAPILVDAEEDHEGMKKFDRGPNLRTNKAWGVPELVPVLTDEYGEEILKVDEERTDDPNYMNQKKQEFVNTIMNHYPPKAFAFA